MVFQNGNVTAWLRLLTMGNSFKKIPLKMGVEPMLVAGLFRPLFIFDSAFGHQP